MSRELEELKRRAKEIMDRPEHKQKKGAYPGTFDKRTDGVPPDNVQW